MVPQIMSDLPAEFFHFRERLREKRLATGGLATYVEDLAAALWQLAGSKAAGLFHLAGSTPASWYEVAEAVFRFAGRPDLLGGPGALQGQRLRGKRTGCDWQAGP